MEPLELVTLTPSLMRLGDALRRRGWRIATAESCTGGLIASACTALAGSSDWFERGFVTYSNEAKVELLGVPPALLQAHGAVSEEVARAMALGALAHAPVQASVAVTGIAGPGGAVPGKPVGTVWLAVATARPDPPAPASFDRADVHVECLHLDGDRQQVRWQTLETALQRLLAEVERHPAP
jgi:nicotinamide-nucleotide amidase